MATKLSEGDSIGMQREVTLVQTVRLLGYDVLVTSRGEHLHLIAKRPQGKAKRLRDVPD